MSMRNYALRRLLYIFPTLLGISIISFALIAASPGDPIQIRMGLFKGEQTEYIKRYYEIGMEIGLLEKDGQDSVTFDITMDAINGFSLKNFSIPGPKSGNIKYTTVTLNLQSDIERNFTMSDYNIHLTVPGNNINYQFIFVADINSYVEQVNTTTMELSFKLTKIFYFSATGLVETGTMYVEHPKYTRINPLLRYLQWMGLTKRYVFEERVYKRSGILQGDLGRSWVRMQGINVGREVTEIITSRLWYTLFLTTPSFIISTVLATVIGVVQATRQYSIWDKGVTLASLVGYSMPTFWLAKLVMLSSYYMFNFTGATDGEVFREPFMLNIQFYKHLILPVLTLVLTGLVFLARLTRSQLLDILRQDYIVTARAKGLSERSVIYKHAFRNAMLPIITVVGMSLPGLLAGAVMTEGVFNWPGLGTVFLESSLSRDHPMMVATNFIFGALFLVFRLLVDLSYAFIDPRIRY